MKGVGGTWTKDQSRWCDWEPHMQRESPKRLVIQVHQESAQRTTPALGRGSAQKPEKPTEVGRQPPKAVAGEESREGSAGARLRERTSV